MAVTAEKVATKDSIKNQSLSSKKDKPRHPFFQPKLTIGPTDDVCERESNTVSGNIMGWRSDAQKQALAVPPILQRKCASCHEEDSVQRKENAKADKQSGAPALVSDALNSSGSPMDSGTKSFMESRFGYNFSQVKIHTGTVAAKSAQAINALAYTAGNDIVFDSGQYAPTTDTGQRLLAHELTHTLQQGNSIRRWPKDAFGRELGFFPTPQQEAYDQESARIGFDKIAASLELNIWADPVYQKLKEEPHKRVEQIVNLVKTKPPGDEIGQRYYYLKKLKIALTTPFNGTETGDESYGCSDDAEVDNRAVVDDALKIEKRDWDGLFADVEENKVASGTNKVERTGEQNKKFYVDRSDVTNIRVHIKVKLNGVPADVSQVKQLEDAIERSVWLTTKGYVLDIEFVDAVGPDVFEFSVVFCEWPNSGNWASSPVTLSHEVHHALGLGDRYDYIESHSGNDQMNVPMRLVWFEQELLKPTPTNNNPNSKMAQSSNPLLNDDVCTVAFEPGVGRDNCIKERTKFNPGGSPLP